MMNPDKLLSDLLLLVSYGTLDEASLKACILRNTGLQCNDCGKFFEERKGLTTSFEIRWGYESTGKDGDVDIWNLCDQCTAKFDSTWEPVCVYCNQSVVRVMAELTAKNPRSSFYADLSGALKYHRENRDWECARIRDRIFCEVCYETVLLSLKFPPLERNCFAESIEALDQEHPAPRKNRIEQAFSYKLEGSFDAFLPYEEALKIRQEKSQYQIIGISGHTDSDSLFVLLGDGTRGYLYVNKLEDLGVPSNDVEKISLLESGRIVKFGKEEISSFVILELLHSKA